jgi:hypothetical protein
MIVQRCARARAAATLANVFFLEIGMTKLKTSKFGNGCNDGDR